MSQPAVFPVINSTLSAGHLALWVADNYGLPGAVCSLIKTNMNHAYLVTAGGTKYVLRVYTAGHRTAAEVAEEVKLLLWLKDAVDLSYPIAAANGAYALEIAAPEGARPVVLFSFAEGRKLRNFPAAFHHSVGAEVARMHAATAGRHIDRTSYTVDVLCCWAYGQVTKYIREDLEEIRFVKRCETVLREVFAKAQLPEGIVHLDIWYDNMSIRDDGSVTFFDFDNCGNGWLVLDLGYYCMQLYFTEPDKAEYEQKKAAFLNGYISVKALSSNELALLPYASLAIWIYYLGVQAHRFDFFANLFLTENYVRMFIARAKEWLTYNGIAAPLEHSEAVLGW